MKITQGNLKPALMLTLSDEEGPLPLTTATGVEVVGYRDGAEVLRRAATSVDDDGVVILEWVDGDTDTVGRIDVAVEVTWVDGLQTYESTGSVDVEPPGAADALLVNVDELVAYMSDVTLTASQRRTAGFVLSGLQRNLERKLNRSLGIFTVTETIYPQPDGIVWTSRRPILEVHTVEPDDAKWLLHVTRRYLTVPGTIDYPDSFYGTTDSAMYWRRDEPIAPVTVSYTGGEPLSPADADDVRWLLLEKAAQIMTNRHDDAKSVKGFETRDTSIEAIKMRWTDEEIGDLGRLRHVVVAT